MAEATCRSASGPPPPAVHSLGSFPHATLPSSDQARQSHNVCPTTHHKDRRSPQETAPRPQQAVSAHRPQAPPRTRPACQTRHAHPIRPRSHPNKIQVTALKSYKPPPPPPPHPVSKSGPNSLGGSHGMPHMLHQASKLSRQAPQKADHRFLQPLTSHCHTHCALAKPFCPQHMQPLKWHSSTTRRPKLHQQSQVLSACVCRGTTHCMVHGASPTQALNCPAHNPQTVMASHLHNPPTIESGLHGVPRRTGYESFLGNEWGTTVT
jgi:hypothetical protein